MCNLEKKNEVGIEKEGIFTNSVTKQQQDTRLA